MFALYPHIHSSCYVMESFGWAMAGWLLGLCSPKYGVFWRANEVDRLHNAYHYNTTTIGTAAMFVKKHLCVHL